MFGLSKQFAFDNCGIETFDGLADHGKLDDGQTRLR